MESFKTALQPWMPGGHPAGLYDVDEISWGPDGLSFILVPDGRPSGQNRPARLRLTWDAGHIISYHVTDETYRADCWGLDFENNGRLYICKDSEYIELFRKKSPLFPDAAIHFVIVGANTIVDILAKDYPVTATSTQ